MCLNPSFSSEVNAPDIDTIRVFVACSASEWLPAKVLEYSILKTATQAVDVVRLYEAPILIPEVVNPHNKPRTPFSFQRFIIPELCKFKGKAIYLDADMQVFSDIKQLWKTSLNNCDLQAVDKHHSDSRLPQYSVMLLNCATLNWKIETIVNMLNGSEITYEELMYEMKLAPVVKYDIHPEWNSLESFDKSNTRLLHYTDMHKQPWVATNNTLGYLWVNTLIEAINNDFIKRSDVVAEIEKGNIRPSLIVQIDDIASNAVADSIKYKRIDKHFSPPYRKLSTTFKSRLKYLMSHYLHSLGLIH